MINLNDFTSAQLEWITDIKQRIEKLQSQLDSISGDAGPGLGRSKGKRKMSAGGRAATPAPVLG